MLEQLKVALDRYCYYISKNLIYLFTFFFKRMVIEMLLNNDIEKTNCSNDFTLPNGNKYNYVQYGKNKNFNHFIWTKSQ